MERKTNFDILRIFAMLSIVTLHYLGVGGAYYNIDDFNLAKITFNFVSASAIEALAIVGVNCFVLISGYFLCESKFKWRKIINLVGQTLFYAVAFFIIFAFIDGVTLGSALKSFLPSLMSTYWFVTVYLGLYLLSPFLNILINGLDKRRFKRLLVIIIVLFSVWQSVLPIAETLDTTKGYGIIWFTVLYMLGAYERKYGLFGFKRNYKNLLIYFAGAIILVAIKLLSIVISTKFSVIARLQNFYYHYNSIIVLIMSLALFKFFSNITIGNQKFGRIVTKIASSTFAVYLIHENFLFRETLWNKILRADAFIDSPYFLLHLIGCVLGVFVGCILVDWIRKGLTVLLKSIISRIKNARNKKRIDNEQEN